MIIFYWMILQNFFILLVYRLFSHTKFTFSSNIILIKFIIKVNNKIIFLFACFLKLLSLLNTIYWDIL